MSECANIIRIVDTGWHTRVLVWVW